MPSLRNILPAFCLLFVFSQPVLASGPDGGMYPINTLHQIPLKKAGLRITENDIYNPNGTGLLQAIVQIGGCTGSFVSGQGLIITNHHCSFSSLAPYSSTVNNLFEKGYLARSNKDELPMKGLSCKIMEDHSDVSAEVLAGTDTINDPLRKKTAIEKNMSKVSQLAQLKNDKLEVEISEMLPGKSYILFSYKVIKDIRIVYIPPRDIGEFGGETDNWTWPRHTGDFSFIRAYVNKNGDGAGYDTSNIPYQPKEYLNINATGADTGDFVFVLGYPGRTYRQEPAEFLKYQQDYQLPFISELYEWQINTMLDLGKSDSAYKIRQDPKIKSIANVMKNYKGKLEGLRKLDLYREKKADDIAIGSKITDPSIRKKYFETLKGIYDVYTSAEKEYLKYAWYNRLLIDDYFIKIAHVVDLCKTDYILNKKPDNILINSSVKLLRDYYKSMYVKFDTVYFSKMLRDANGFDADNRPMTYGDAANGRKADPGLALAVSKLLDSSYIFDLLQNKANKLPKLKDPFITLAKSYYADAKRLDSTETVYKTQIDALTATYIDLKMQALQEQFIPDANHTLRLTYGYVKGYSPRDGVYCHAFTTVAGMIEKNGENPDYKVDEELMKVFKQNVANEQAKNHDVPLCLLYNTDTTGGNSGSPVLNKYGQLIGLNFDRNYEATINDYAWDDKYSRSIGLDIRFVLWDLKNVAGAKNILDEMFIDN